MSRILIVDDEGEFRSVLREFLEGAEHTVLEAPDGAVALNILETAPIDVAIVDIFMPKVDGLEFLGKLRQRSKALQVIAVSGGGVSQSGEGPLRVARLLGAVATLEKPFDFGVMLDIVDKCTAG